MGVLHTHRWRGPVRTTRLQANALASDVSDRGASVHAIGLWLDGSHGGGRRTRTTTGSFVSSLGSRGATSRSTTTRGRLLPLRVREPVAGRWTAASTRSIRCRGAATNGTYLTLNGRYQFNTRIGVRRQRRLPGCSGGTIPGRSRRSATTRGRGLSAGCRSAARPTATRRAATPQQVALEHSWNMPAGTRLSTTLTATRDATGATRPVTRRRGSTFRRFGVGVLGGGDITSNVSVDANLQYNLLNLQRHPPPASTATSM